MTHFKGKKTVGWRAHQAAMRVVPMIDDPEKYRRALDYFKLGYVRGFRKAQQLTTRPPKNS